ncbi:DUF3189 family protein [Lederbergia citrea]|uniref:DUF3189 family protein n=1 Tax=Lederbergia citrea TaxID=2833581 RepID=A0A942US97_9BACI|nr:DUF3189 family protein [Lederbergia citrea]MBS4179172.1 DUF3189 family protein [Lederbergia citrea]MBS4205835.1 DUF3189 family protein [Lederbergia citrea]MBS4224717.1 DUF3189 family protein [Lederbergia citrea]
MIYIYNDYGGTHTTSLAAAFHLKKLPTDRTLTKEEILNVDYFNKLTSSDFGKLIFHGIDEDAHPVYTIGRKSQKLVVPAMKNLTLLFQERGEMAEKIIFSNTSPTVPFPMSIGGFFSRGLKIDFIGVPLLVAGAKICCNDIIQLVQNTKRIGRSTNDQITVLENKEFK